MKGQEILLFKGQFINQFLYLEKEIEIGIIKFFQFENFHRSDSKQYIDLWFDLRRQNRQIEFFWKNCIFENVSMGFMFNHKFTSYKFMMMQKDDEIYSFLNESLFKSIFDLIEMLQRIRNNFAHSTLYIDTADNMPPFSLKTKIDIKKSWLDVDTGHQRQYYFEKNIKYFYTKKVCKDIYSQLEAVTIIISCINHWYNNLSNFSPRPKNRHLELQTFVAPYLKKLNLLINRGAYEFLGEKLDVEAIVHNEAVKREKLEKTKLQEARAKDNKEKKKK